MIPVFDTGEIVVCVENTGAEGWLTLDHEYVVVGYDVPQRMAIVMDDSGQKDLFMAWRFESRRVRRLMYSK